MTPLSTLITLLYLTSSQFAVARPLRGADLAAILARSSRSDVPITFRRASLDLTEAQVAALAPPLGWTAGVNPSGTGTCDGAVPDENGNPIQVPCDCPPSQEVYIADLTANVNAGFALNNTVLPVSYPLDDSIQSQLTRLTAASVTIQNLAGIGAGCPVTSTTFAAQQAALLAELPTAAPPPPSPSSVPATSSSAFASSSLPAPSSSNTVVATTPAPVSTQPSSASASTLASSTIPSSPSVAPTSSASTMASASGTSSASPLPTGVPSNKTIIELSPQIGWTAGINPKGNGNCDGAQLDDTGAPIQVPCACPPEQAAFDQALVINVITGHAVNNTDDAMPFPTDSSARSLATRIFAAIATLQNLEGPGVGCPVASTTFLAQLNTALAAF